MRMPRNGFCELRAQPSSQQLDGCARVTRPQAGLDATLRKISYRMGTSHYMVLTTLVDPSFSRSALRNLYGARWGIEEFFKTLKQVGKIESFHARSKNGILQEIYAFLLLQTLTVLLKTTCKQPRKSRREESTKMVAPSRKGTRKLNHKHAITWVSLLSPLLLQKNVPKCHIILCQNLLSRGSYNAYGGRHYPRVSYKPSARWRCTKTKAQRLGGQALGP